MQIYISNELVRDYVPVVDKSGSIALYDKVSKQYFYGDGDKKF